MAAYAALTSLMQIMYQLEHHPFPPISIDKKQVKSLTAIVTFLQKFLEGYDSPFVDSDEADPLEMRIAGAAYTAEDVIESYIVDNIQLAAAATHDDELITSSGKETGESVVSDGRKKRICWFFNCFRGSKELKNDGKKNKNEVPNDLSISTSDYNKETNGINLYQDVWKVIEEMDLIKKEATKMMRERTAVGAHQLQRNIIRSASLSGNNSTVVGFDDVLLRLLEKLTGGPSGRQVIPITGMGGIGKTTLARKIFDKALVKDHFDICAWVTISQQYNTKEILSQILSQASGKSREKSEEELGDELHKYLFRRRNLIVMDDIWSIDVWEKMRYFFPDCQNGSRIVVTTRQSFLTSQLSDSNYGLDMKFLDEVNSWNLFSKTVFGEERFPLQLEEIGKKIVQNCRGFPLSIVVIGGLLAKSEHTQEYWEHIEQKLSSIVNSENNEYCLKILKLSYNNLPTYLKPSFLYMGTFEEDARIRVSTLIKLWVCEGFLKQKNGKRLEIIGKEFLKDLIDRNLILVDELGFNGNIKYCKMHDLLRDLCMKQGEKERFYDVIGQDNPRGIHNHNRRRMVYPRRSTSEEMVLDVLKSATSHVRSLTSQHHKVELSPDFRLMRIFNASDLGFFIYGYNKYCLADVIHKLRNSRYVAINTIEWRIDLPSSVNFLWNLHTLRVVSGGQVVTNAPDEIWKMSQLRHIDFTPGCMYLRDPPSGSSIVILENLQTLKGVLNLKCGEDVVKRIPNIKKLLIKYDYHRDDYCLSNLKCLLKLESLSMLVYGRDDDLLHNITFPHSLSKLTLESYDLQREDMLGKVGGSLPLLEKLCLIEVFFETGEWITKEGHFPNLKFLRVSKCRSLRQWMIEDSSHFPRLERLHLDEVKELEEIPKEIGEIPTLQSIKLSGCSGSAVESAKRIIEEQEELQGEATITLSC